MSVKCVTPFTLYSPLFTLWSPQRLSGDVQVQLQVTQQLTEELRSLQKQLAQTDAKLAAAGVRLGVLCDVILSGLWMPFIV